MKISVFLKLKILSYHIFENTNLFETNMFIVTWDLGKTELANAIKNLLENPDLIEKLGEEGYNFVKSECNCVSVASNVLNLYEKTLKNNENK